MNPAEFQNIAAAEEQMWWFRGMRRILSAVLDDELRRRRIDGPVLEGGCGTGYQSLLLNRQFGLRMHSIDLSERGLRYARGRGLRLLAQADLAALPYPDETFSAAFALDVLAHFALGDEARPIAEMARVLKRGGLLVLRASAFDLLRSRHSQFVDEKQRFSERRLRDAVEREGFRILRSTYANSVLLPVAFLKFRVWEPLTNTPPASGVALGPAWLEALLERPLQLEAWFIRHGVNLPVGQSIVLLAEKEAS